MKENGIESRPCGEIFRQITDALFVLDTQGRILYANPAAERLTGRNQSEVAGKNVWEEFPEAARLKFRTEYEKVVKSRVTAAFEEYYPHTGTWVDVRIYSTGAGFLVHVRDITERKEQELELAAINQITDIALRRLSLAKLMDILLAKLAEIVGADAAVLFLNENNRLVARASYGLEEEVAEQFSLEIGRGFAGKVASTRSLVYVEDARHDPLVINPIVKKKGIRAMLGVPVTTEDKLVGVLHVGWLSMHPQNIHEEHLLSVTADRCATAIVNARLQDDLAESEERYRTVANAAFEGIVIHEGGRILEYNGAFFAMFGYDAGELVDKQFISLITTECRQIVIDNVKRGYQFPYEVRALKKDGSTFIAEIQGRNIAYKNRPARAVSIRDVTERVQAQEALDAERRRLRTVLDTLPVGVFISDSAGRIVQTNNAATLVWGGNPSEPFADAYKGWWADTGKPVKAEDWAIRKALSKGEVSFGEIIDIERFDGTRGTILNSAAPIRDEDGQIIGAVACVQDITELRRVQQDLAADRQRITVLESIAAAGISTLNLKEALDTIVERTARALKSNSCHIMLLNEKTGKFTVQAVYGDVEPDYTIGKDEGFVGKVFREQHTVYVADAQSDPIVVNPHIKKAETKSLLGAPIITRENILGVIYIDTRKIRKFTPEETRLLELIAARTALIVENSRLFEEVVKSREKISGQLKLLQRALLPPEKPDLGPGYAIATAYIPGSKGQDIGGDFYDVFKTENGRTAFLIGDVSGKGIEAASVASATRNTIHAFAYDMPSPAGVLTHANAVLYPEQKDSGGFVTVFLAVLDTKNGHVCFSGAGHPSPVIVKADGRTEFPCSINLPLSVMERCVYAESETWLAPGDRIILYTDGLSEARHDSQMFGTEGIASTLDAHRSESLDAAVSHLIEDASNWAEGYIRDDVAVMAIERQMEAESGDRE